MKKYRIKTKVVCTGQMTCGKKVQDFVIPAGSLGTIIDSDLDDDDLIFITLDVVTITGAYHVNELEYIPPVAPEIKKLIKE